jgi:hypothetical protein
MTSSTAATTIPYISRRYASAAATAAATAESYNERHATTAWICPGVSSRRIKYLDVGGPAQIGGYVRNLFGNDLALGNVI